MRKYGIAVIAVVALLLAGTATMAKTQIEWMEWPRPEQDAYVKAIIASFEAANPDITVKYTPMTSKDQVVVGAAAGTSPDVIGYWGETLTGWMVEGMFLNLDPYLEKFAFDWDDFNPMQLAAFSWKGNQYVLPHFLATEAMFYNKDRFSRAGLPEPDDTWTWDDRREVGKKLTERQDGQTTFWGNMVPMTSLDVVASNVRAAGGQHYPPGNPSMVTWDSPEALAALDYWREILFEDESAPLQTELLPGVFRGTFAAGRVGMFESLSIDIAHYKNVDFGVGITQVTKGPAGRVSIATQDGYGVWAGTSNPEAAAKFLLHLVSPEANQIRAQMQSLQPARRSVLMDWVDITLAAFPFITKDDVMQFYYAGESAEPLPTWSDPVYTTRMLNNTLPQLYTRNTPASVVMADALDIINRQLGRSGQ